MGHNLCNEEGGRDVAGGKGHWACVDVRWEGLMVNGNGEGRGAVLPLVFQTFLSCLKPAIQTRK